MASSSRSISLSGGRSGRVVAASPSASSKVLAPRRVALVGAGRIADTHAEVLKHVPGVVLAAVIDPALAQAEALARKWGFEGAYPSLDAALAAGPLHAAHVLVPPPLHRAVGEQCLAAGLDTLLEKPMAETDADCAALQAAAQAAGVALHVNQNFVHHPAQAALKQVVQSGSLGPLRHVSCQFAVPLGQLQSRQFGHWMFREPRNLLLEQVVHPLSQIDDLVGAVRELSVAVPPPTVADDLPLQTGWMISMVCERGTAELFVRIGHSFPVWTLTGLFDDGIATADCGNNFFYSDSSTRGMDFYDSYRRGNSIGGQLKRAGRRVLADYLFSTAKLRPRSDAFFQSMKGSIADFHRALDAGEGLDGAQGRRVAALCGDIAARAGLGSVAPRPQPQAPSGSYDVLVIGGTGFIGRPVVAALLEQGKRVAVLARNVSNLPPLFLHERVGVVRGDVTNRADLEEAMEGVSAVVNLAHAGGADSWPEVERRIVGGARMVAELCLETGVRQLVHASTIAALYLGDAGTAITGDTPPDPRCERRALYSRAKALAERELMRMRDEQGLGLTILRPGVVIGEGGPPFHSGIGLYNREQHSLGWNAGTNPLPLVLAEDVASAIAACLARPEAIGRNYNVIGDVRLSAREYTQELARATGRPLSYHPQSLVKQQANELMKWAVKRVTGRREPVPSMADLKSRGMRAPFDTSDIKRDLGWQPVADRDAFVAKAFAVHAQQ